MLFAIDTNPLIDWAQGYDDIPDCFNLIKKRVPGVSIIVPPTVLHELGHFAQTNTKNLGAHALKALELIRDEPLRIQGKIAKANQVTPGQIKSENESEEARKNLVSLLFIFLLVAAALTAVGALIEGIYAFLGGHSKTSAAGTILATLKEWFCWVIIPTPFFYLEYLSLRGGHKVTVTELVLAMLMVSPWILRHLSLYLSEFNISAKGINGKTWGTASSKEIDSKPGGAGTPASVGPPGPDLRPASP
jgi:hypothetical protein